MTTMTVSIDLEALTGVSCAGETPPRVFEPVEPAVCDSRAARQFQDAMGGALAENAQAQEALAVASAAISAAFGATGGRAAAIAAPVVFELSRIRR